MGSEGRMLLWGWLGPAPAGWFCSPRWWHLVGSLLRSPMDHLQRPEHPSAEAGPSLPVLGGAGHGCWGSRGWLVAITGVMQWQGSVPSERQEPPGAGGQRGPHGLGGAKPLRDAPPRAQAKCWRWGVDLGSLGGSGRPCGQSQTMECSPHPMGHPTVSAPCGEAACGAGGAEGSPARQGECLILLLMAPP